MLLSRKFIRPAFEAHAADRVEAWNKRLAEQGLFDLFALRMTPFIPSALVNVLMGLASFRS